MHRGATSSPARAFVAPSRSGSAPSGSGRRRRTWKEWFGWWRVEHRGKGSPWGSPWGSPCVAAMQHRGSPMGCPYALPAASGQQCIPQYIHLPGAQFRDGPELLERRGFAARNGFEAFARDKESGVEVELAGYSLADLAQAVDALLEIRVAIPAWCTREARELVIRNGESLFNGREQSLTLAIHHAARHALDGRKLLPCAR